MTRYELAYKFIPYLISEFEDGKIRQSDLVNVDFYKHITQDEIHEFNWDDFNIDHQILSETIFVGIFEFPAPERMPEAKFGLMYFGFKLKSIKYYTLERSISLRDKEIKWVVGTITNGGNTHLNLGTFIGEPTKENFIQFTTDNFEKTRNVFGFLKRIFSSN